MQYEYIQTYFLPTFAVKMFEGKNQFMKQLSIVVILLCCATFSNSQNQNNMIGKEFWLSFLENSITPSNLQLHVSAEKKTNVKVEYPRLGAGSTQIFVVNAGSTLTQNLSLANAYTTGTEAVKNNGIRITTDNPVSIIAANNAINSSDGALLMPLESYSNSSSYIINTNRGDKLTASEFIVLAVEDNTNIEVIPSALTGNGRPAGIPIVFTLQRGQHFQLQAADSGNLSGSTIKVLNGCKKIAVFSGSRCSKINYIPSCSGCDHLYEQTLPISQWDKEFFVFPFNGMTAGTESSIIAAYQNTDIYIDGIFIRKLNAGEHFQYSFNYNAHTIKTTKPIQVQLFMKSGGCNGQIGNLGDPSMVGLFGNNKMVKFSRFGANETNNCRNHFVTIICKESHKNLLTFDFAPLDTINQFNQIGRNNGLVFYSGQILKGGHTISCDSGFLAYSFGYGSDESYAYPVAASFEKTISNFTINKEKVCDAAFKFEFRALSDTFNQFKWNLGSGFWEKGNPCDTIFNKTGTYKIYLLSSFNGVSSCDTITKTIVINKSNPIEFGKDDTTMCPGQNIKFSYPITPGFKYLWSTGSRTNTIITNKTGKLWLEVTDTNNCVSSDTILISDADCNKENLKVPNVFTPGKDGFNDKFEIELKGYNTIVGTIYNRWGVPVFIFDYPEYEFWNGKYMNKGADCTEGTYYYIFEAKNSITGHTKRVNGVVMLLR